MSTQGAGSNPQEAGPRLERRGLHLQAAQWRSLNFDGPMSSVLWGRGLVSRGGASASGRGLDPRLRRGAPVLRPAEAAAPR